MADIQVIGIGLPRTGTTSLKAALKILSYVPGTEHDRLATCLVGDGVNIPYNRFKTLDKEYPDAKFIFTKRSNVETWLSSVSQRTKVIEKNEGVLRQRERMYGSRDVVPEIYIPFYLKREVDVLSYFSNKYGNKWKTKLLVICFEEHTGDENWSILCSFLDRPLSGKPFPHKNKSK